MEIIKGHNKNIVNHDYEANPPLGIDLGTTNSVIARWVNVPARVGSDVYHLNTLGYQQKDNRMMPSMVYFDEDDCEEPLKVGELSYKKRLSDAANVASAIKREISDASKKIPLADSLYSSIELTTEIIKGLFVDPMATGLKNPAGVVVSVPYYFKQNQNYNTRQAVEKALAIAFQKYSDLERPKLLALIPEPIAAALNYAIEYLDYPLDQILLSFDLGGGTLDITILRLEITGTHINFEVLASDGSSQFGGEDFDQILEAFIEEQEKISYEGLAEKDKRRQKRIIREAVITAKEELTSKEATSIMEPNLPNGRQIEIPLSRKEFEALLAGNNGSPRNFGSEIETILSRVIKKAKISNSSVTTILPVGGSSKIPFFQKIVKQQFPDAVFLSSDNSLFFSVAKGASIYAAYLLDKEEETNHLGFKKSITFIVRTSHSLGVQKFNGRFGILIPENTIVPHSEEKIFFPEFFSDHERKTVKLSPIKVYQGDSKKAFENTYIGEVRVPTIYSHGRKLDEIPLSIKFTVTVTTVDVFVKVPQGSENQTDIKLIESIHLEMEKK